MRRNDGTKVVDFKYSSRLPPPIAALVGKYLEGSEVVDFRGCGFQRLWISEVVDFRGCGFQRLWISEVVDFRGCGFQRLWISEVVVFRMSGVSNEWCFE